jgi:5-formyltetrahydrofolate cyclo-ligase
MNKKELRQLIRSRKRLFDKQALDEQSFVRIKQLMSHPRLIAAQTIMMYYSLPDEVDTHEAIRQLVKQGKTVLLPVVTGEDSMILRRYEQATDLQTGAFGIMEPVGQPFNDYDQIELAVVPGVAFDAEGHRLGRGRGYYDRFLPLLPHAYKLGLCFDFQKVEHVPTDANDIRMDEVL